MQEENGIKCISDFCTSTDDTEIVCRFSSVVSYFLKAKFSLQLKKQPIYKNNSYNVTSCAF